MVQRSLRIALVIRNLEGRSGGAERLFCELANILVDAGHEVTCLSSDRQGVTPFYPVSAKARIVTLGGQNAPSASRLRHSLIVLSRKTYDLLMKSAVQKLIGKSAWRLVHGRFTDQLRGYFKRQSQDIAISFLPPANTPTLVASRGLGLRVIPTNHNLPAEDFGNPKRWDSNPYDRKLRLECLRHAAAVHVLFPSFAHWFPADIRSKCVAIPNYVSPSIAQSSSLNARDKTIIAVGRLTKAKNYSALVRAWSEIVAAFPEWQIKLFGVGPEKGRLTALIKKLGVERSFLLAGHSDQIPSEYRKASIFCHPALFEGFGLSAAEALAGRLPVVAFDDCAGLDQFVNETNGVLVARETGAEGLAAAMKRLIVDEDLRRCLGDRGPEILETFSIEKYIARWLQLIDEVANEPVA